MFRIVFVIFIAIFVSGCSFKPDIPIQKSPDFNASIASVNINDKWWEVFNSKTLNSLVESALTHNSDLNLALNSIESSRVALGLQELEYLPNVNISGSAIRQNNFPKAVDLNSHGVYSIGAMLNYEIDLWGRVRNSVGAAKSMYKSSIYDYESAKLSIASNVAYSYFLLLSLKAQESILQDTLKSYINSMEFRQNQLKAGSISKIVYYQAKSQVDSAKSQLDEITDLLSKANTALLILTGKNYEEILHNDINVDISLSSIVENANVNLPAGISSDILLKRPDVASSLEILKSTNFLIGVRKTEYFPQISLTGMFGYSSGEFDRLFVSNANTWNIGGSLIGPLIDFGRTSKRVELANLEQNASLIMYDKTVKEAFGEVRDALNNRENSLKKQDSLKELVDSQTKIYDLAETRFNSGYSDYLELLDAQRYLLNAKLSLVKSKQDVLNSMVGVYKAFGGGFELKDKEDINILNNKNN